MFRVIFMRDMFYIYIYIGKYFYIIFTCIYIYSNIKIYHRKVYMFYRKVYMFSPNTALRAFHHALKTWLRQELSYVEYFAGEAQVFKAVRADHNPSVAVDIRFMEGPHNPMDILSDSGFAFNPELLGSGA